MKRALTQGQMVRKWPRSRVRHVTPVSWTIKKLQGVRALTLITPRVLAVALALGTVLIGAGGPPAAEASASSIGWTAPLTLFQSKNHGALLPTVSCVSAKLCVAVGAKGSGGVYLSGARTWSSPVVINRGAGLASISCLSSGVCEAVGAAYFSLSGATYRRLKGKWSDGPSTKFALMGVSCASATFCAGVDNLSPKGHGFIFNGQRWSSPTTLATSADSISCPTTRYCAAVSQSGNVLYYENGSWSKATSIDPSGTPVSVSCSSASFCVAVDSNGGALTDQNGKWSKPVAIDPNASLAAVSCPTTEFCVAVDVSGAALSYDGSHWSSPQTISPNVQFTDVSCPTVKFCAAVGQNAATTAAYVTTYEPSR